MSPETANESFERLKESLRESPTPESMKRAGEVFKEYESKMKREGKGSRPVICSLGFKKGYPSAVPLDKAGDLIATNKEFYELMSKVVSEGEE